MKIPLCMPDIGEEEIRQASEVLRSGWLVNGPKNKMFEEEFARYMGVKKAVTLNSCTSALQLAIQAQNLKGEIIVPSFTFSASANSIVNAGCGPVFADIDYDTCNIDPADIEKRINDKTVGIMPVHFAGQSCRMDEIMEIAGRHGLKVIEDSAETIGGEFQGKKTGSFGTGCFSFFPTKNMTTGEGGMITTNDEKLAEQVEALKGHGMLSSTWKREKEKKPWLRASILAGYNFRMTDIQAALGLVQLGKLDRMNEMRRSNAKYLNRKLDFDGIETPVEAEGAKHVYQMYTIKLDMNRIDRSSFVLKLREKGIDANVHFDPPVHLQPYYIRFGRKGLPVTERVANSIVTLPMYPKLGKEELDYMVVCIGECLKSSMK